MIFSKYVTLFIIFAGVGGVFGQVKKPEPIPVKKPFSASRQIIVVTTKDWKAVPGSARRFERKTTHSKWQPAGEPFPVVVGRSGLGLDGTALSTEETTASSLPYKIEGDGRSPAGLFPLTKAFGTDADVETGLPYTRLGEFTECVDDINSQFYNKIVDRMQVGNFDWRSSEKMLAVGPQYELGVFVAYNSYPPKRGNGSCIFLHIWKDPSTGTSGCTAMEKADLEKTITWLDPKKTPYLVQFTEEEYFRQQKRWKLPKIKA